MMRFAASFRIVTIAMDNHIRPFRRLISRLDPRDIGSFVSLCFPVNPLRIASDADFQGTIDENLHKSAHLLPRPVAVGPTVAVASKMTDTPCSLKTRPMKASDP
jgi:hypothetical protein